MSTAAQYDTGLFDYTFHLIDPKEKTAEWFLDYIKLRYPQMTSIFASPMWNGRYDFATIRSYGMGLQDIGIYQSMFNPQGYMTSRAGGANTGSADWTGLGWNIVSPIPKYKQIVSAGLEKIPVNVQCEAVDELALNKKNEDMLRLKISKQVDEILAGISSKLGHKRPMKSGFAKNIASTPSGDASSDIKDMEFDLENDNELQMYMDLEYKQAVEIANELLIETILYLNEYDEILKEVRNDALDFGLAACRVYMDNNTCQPKIEWLRLENVMVGVGRRRDFKDVDAWAYPDLLTVNQIIRKLGKELTPDMVRKIFKHGVTTNGYWDGSSYNRSLNNNAWNIDKLSRIDFDRVRVKISYIAFKSQNCETTEISKGKYGSVKYKDREYGYNGSKEEDGKIIPIDPKKSTVEQRWAEVVYKGYYIDGIDAVFDFGLLSNMVREQGKEEIVMLDLVMYRFSDKSFTEHMIPHADGIELAWLKIQLELLMSLPSGYEIDWDRIAEVSIGDGGKLDQLEVARMMFQTGKIPVRTLDEDGNPLPNAQMPAFRRIENGIAEVIEGYWMEIEREIAQIEALIGYSPQMAGAAPQPRQPVKGLEIAAAASANATYYLVSGLQTMIENTAIMIGSMLQDMATYGGQGWEELKNAVGNYNLAVIESMDKIPLHRFGIFLKEVLSDEQVQQFKQLAMDAYGKNEIDLSDIIQIWFLKDKNYKQAIALFNLKRKKQMLLNQQNGQSQMQMAQQSEQRKAQLEIAIAQIDAKKATDVATISGDKALQLQQLKMQGNYDSELVRNDLKKEQIELQGEFDLQKEKIKSDNKPEPALA